MLNYSNRGFTWWTQTGNAFTLKPQCTQIECRGTQVWNHYRSTPRLITKCHYHSQLLSLWMYVLELNITVITVPSASLKNTHNPRKIQSKHCHIHMLHHAPLTLKSSQDLMKHFISETSHSICFYHLYTEAETQRSGRFKFTLLWGALLNRRH